MLARRLGLLPALTLIFAASQSFADIYQWAWVDPSDHSQGVMQSSTLCPSGSGVNALPGATLNSLDLTQAYLIGANLTGSYLYSSTLANADMQNANLSQATLFNSNLTGATLSGANVYSANLGNSNLTSSQLYSTASYQAGDLRGITLASNDLTGWNFTGQNLRGASLYSTTLTGANFSGANLQLTDFFGATLGGANLTNANLQNTNWAAASLGGANLTGADLRASLYFDGFGVNLTNTIDPAGHIQGVSLNATNPLLVVRNSSTGIPIRVSSGMTVTGGGTLQVVFDGPTWNSRISFNAGASAVLGGDLDLQVASGVDLGSLLGHGFQVFNWSGVSLTGQFNQITSQLPAGYSWDTSALYTSGIVDLMKSAIGPVNGQWATDGGGAWSGTANWSGCSVPGQPLSTALFGTALTAGSANINLDSNVNLADLSFSTTGGANYVVSSSSGNSLSLSNTGGPAAITDSGSNTIAAPITLGSNLSVSASAGSELTIAGAISESGTSSSLTFSGGGILVLSGTNNYSGGMFVESGRVVVANSAALSDGSNLTIGDPAAFAPIVPASSSVVGLSTSPVPEPSTLLLVTVATVGFLLRRTRLAKLRAVNRLVA